MLTKSSEIIENIKKGAFLTTKFEDTLNTMIISWGTIGIIWHLPIFTVMVRDSRFTNNIIQKSREFSLTVPMKYEMIEELKYCGSKSGKDVDKFKELNLSQIEGQTINTPFIKCRSYVLECKTFYSQRIDEEFNDNIKEFYKDKNYHTFYYGKILNIIDNSK